MASEGRASDRSWRRGVEGATLLASLVVSAYLMAVAVGRPDHSWLAWTSLLPLFVAIRVWTPARAMACGAFWGACLYAFLLAGANISPGARALALLIAIPAVYAYLGARLTRRVGFSPLLVALGWIGVELALRPLSWRHGLLAGTQGDGALVRLVGGFLGYAFVGFVVAYANALLLCAVSQVRLKIPGGRPVTKVDDYRRSRLPRTFAGFACSGIRPSQPRGPPVPPAAATRVAAGAARATQRRTKYETTVVGLGWVPPLHEEESAMKLRTWTVCLLAAVLMGAAGAQAQTTFDQDSFVAPRSMANPGAGVLLTEGPGCPALPGVAIPAAVLGLGAGDDIDAISFGDDPIGAAHRVVFSVEFGAAGAGGSGVAFEVGVGTPPTCPPPAGPPVPPEAHGDLFVQVPALTNILAPAGLGYAFGAATGDEYDAGSWQHVGVPVIDDLDAFDYSSLPGLDDAEIAKVFFSLRPGSPTLAAIPATPGDILWKPPGAPPAIATLLGGIPATAANLGIPGNDIDGLTIIAYAPGTINLGAVGPCPGDLAGAGSTHLVEFSIAPGGAFVPAGVLIRIGAGAARVKTPPVALGLVPGSDNVNALEAFKDLEGQEKGIPVLSEWGLVVMAVLLVAAGAIMVRRHRRMTAGGTAA